MALFACHVGDENVARRELAPLRGSVTFPARAAIGRHLGK